MRPNLRAPPALCLLAFSLPAHCLAFGCTCETLCGLGGPAACLAASAAAAVALFVALCLIGELQLLAGLHARGSSHSTSEK